METFFKVCAHNVYNPSRAHSCFLEDNYNFYIFIL